jgi:hypothetical protein
MAKREDVLKASRKKEQGASPALEIVSTQFFPENLDLILIAGRRCLCAPGLLPRLGPPDFNLTVGLNPQW